MILLALIEIFGTKIVGGRKLLFAGQLSAQVVHNFFLQHNFFRNHLLIVGYNIKTKWSFLLVFYLDIDCKKQLVDPEKVWEVI